MQIFKFFFKKKENISSITINHSSIGEFNNENRLISGGHIQKNIDELNRRNQKYEIVKIYSNGVRVGNVKRHKNTRKQTGTNQSWFPISWNDTDIKKAGQSISKGEKYPDGKIKVGNYKHVNVGIIRTQGVIITIFPTSVQKSRKGVILNEYKKIKELIEENKNIELEDDIIQERIWKDMIEILSSDLNEDIKFIDGLDAEDLIYISPIFDDLSKIFKSIKLIECFKNNAQRTGLDLSVDIQCAIDALK
ncbi:MAG: EndoU domain-containing protein [Acholeplasmatales bacterium]|nr:EndoU domain-containing protein [Acholeplasmatales bacterium]